MSFVQNGSFEDFVPTSVNTNNISSESNPFGLKDFSRMLDAKFGNSAFSDNILSAPRGNISTTNPFDSKALDKLDTRKFNFDASMIKPKESNIFSGGPSEVTGNESVFTSAAGGTSGGGMKFGGFNKGTGMATGGRAKHKLDFCY